ncbi:MAG: MmgE/PrpD family protein [Burkholderiales bacterium]|jgi:2-methylcitrate dehydratase PrpD|nr:MmgE/PrpD family protein [Burkholderiales bacterium]
MTTTLTKQLITQCLHELPKGIQEETLKAASQCLVDCLATAYAAYGEAPIDMLRKLYIDSPTTGASTVIGYGEKARPADAALVNGAMISLQLFDDNQAQMRGHPSGPLLPAVLALAELKDASIKEALTAFIIGYEVECRFGTILNPSHYELGWHATATQGTLAAVIASSLILGLDDHTCAHALGITASMVGGVRRNFGTMTMSLHSGLASSNGIRAAQLAEQGFTADPEIFDGPMNLAEIFSREWSPDLLEKNLPLWGKPFMIVHPGATFKLYPCGRPPLFAVDCVIEIQEKYAIDLKDIEKIQADVSFLYPRTLIHQRPINGLQAKASLQYCIATTFLDTRPTLKSFTDSAVARPEINALIDLIEVHVPPHLTEDIPAVRKAPFEQPVKITVQTKSGKTYSATVPIHKGSPQNPASPNDLQQKFIDCATMHIPLTKAKTILDFISQPNAKVRALMQLLQV